MKLRQAPDLWPVNGDPDQLANVILDLAGNARWLSLRYYCFASQARKLPSRSDAAGGDALKGFP